MLVPDTVRSSTVRRNVRLLKAIRSCVEFVGGPEQGFRRCFAYVTNRGLNYICGAGYLSAAPFQKNYEHSIIEKSRSLLITMWNTSTDVMIQ